MGIHSFVLIILRNGPEAKELPSIRFHLPANTGNVVIKVRISQYNRAECLIYRSYPHAGKTRLAMLHFWLHNIGLPVMQGSLFNMMTTANHGLVVGAIIGSLLIVTGVLLFTVNLFQQIRND
jgi:hypothetical protein